MQSIIQKYRLERHVEGGWFKELYTTPETAGKNEAGRALAGSIYFLLAENDISHFHRIDCEEIWYYHQGCGLKIYFLNADGSVETKLLGMDIHNGQDPMVVIPQGSIFAAENIDKGSFTFVSCVTAPKFRYEGFELFKKQDCPQAGAELARLFIE